jgi:hypothetical protein
MRKGKLIYNVILHILAIIGAIIFLTSCNDSEKERQRKYWHDKTEVIENRVDSLQRIHERNKIWINQ